MKPPWPLDALFQQATRERDSKILARRASESFNSGPFRHASPLTWAKWSLQVNAFVWEAVALHCAMDPDCFDAGADSIHSNDGFSGVRPFIAWLDSAELHVKHGTLATVETADDPCNSIVNISEYAAWAKRLGAELPTQFPNRPLQAVVKPSSGWGSHRTQLLDDLMAGLHEFWLPIEEGGKYDRSDPSTAPKNVVVADWLRNEHKISKNIAKAMATILRADNVPEGPRVRRKKEG